MENGLFQGGVLMHSYLRAVGFSKITKRSSIRQIITDVVEKRPSGFVEIPICRYDPTVLEKYSKMARR